MSKYSVSDIFSEIIKACYNVDENEVKKKADCYRSDLENKFRGFLRCLYESVLLEKCEKFDIYAIGKKNKEAYDTFKKGLARLSLDISYANFTKWINIKEIADFYRITEVEIDKQRLQIEFYNECKKMMWKFLKDTSHIKNIEQVTQNSLNAEKIYEHIKKELEKYSEKEINASKTIESLKRIHSKELDKLQEFEKKKDNEKEFDEDDGKKVQIAKLYYLEKQILSHLSDFEYDEYYKYFEEHSKEMKNGLIKSGERKSAVRYELVKWLILEDDIDLDTYLDPNEQDFVLRCRKEFVEKRDKLFKEIIRSKTEEMREEVSAFWELEQEITLKKQQSEKVQKEKIQKIKKFYEKKIK